MRWDLPLGFKKTLLQLNKVPHWCCNQAAGFYLPVQEVWAVRTGTQAVTADRHCHSPAIPKRSLALCTLTAEHTIKWTYTFILLFQPVDWQAGQKALSLRHFLCLEVVSASHKKTNFLFIHKGLARKHPSYKYRALWTAQCCPSHMRGWAVSLHISLTSQKPLLKIPRQVCEGPSYLNQYQAELSESLQYRKSPHLLIWKRNQWTKSVNL